VLLVRLPSFCLPAPGRFAMLAPSHPGCTSASWSRVESRSTMLLNETSIASAVSKASPVRNCHAPSSASREAMSTGFTPSTMDRTVKQATLGGLSNGQSRGSEGIAGSLDWRSGFGRLPRSRRAHRMTADAADPPPCNR
jgi:hypothetical protein